jgi:NAD(P)-dependent dehydrogenase (short-subunit alcohol dehydrogenase family)
MAPPEEAELAKQLIGQTKLGARFGTPEEIADGVLLIASEKAAWITGQWISVSGGLNLG